MLRIATEGQVQMDAPPLLLCDSSPVARAESTSGVDQHALGLDVARAVDG